jgi:deoxyinosine 3'endonuclease (endonuclease V)
MVYQDYKMVKLTQPYIAGFLAFREVDHLLELLAHQRSTRPEVTPQVVFVDGNGVLHPKGFGLASHLGVLAATVTVGWCRRRAALAALA